MKNNRDENVIWMAKSRTVLWKEQRMCKYSESLLEAGVGQFHGSSAAAIEARSLASQEGACPTGPANYIFTGGLQSNAHQGPGPAY